MSRSTALLLALAASVVVHLALVLALPGRQVFLPVSVERLFEVEIAPEPPPLEEPQPAPEPVPEPVPIPEPQPDPTPKPEPEPEPPPEPPAPEPLARTAAADLGQALAESARQPSPPPPAAPPIRLPRREPALPEPGELAWELPPSPGPEPIPRHAAPSREPAPTPDPAVAAGLAEGLLRGLAAEPAPVPALPATPPRLEIEGPVGVERRVVEEPPFPRVPIRNPVDVRIKFWVSPRGDVIRAIPIQRGDPELDAAALAYIRGFRFNPLPPADEGQQWGTIRVMFRLE